MKKNIWIFCHYNMPPDYGHLNRHYNFAKYLKRNGYNPVVFAGSNPHNTNIQIVDRGTSFKLEDKYGFPFIFVKTCIYHNSKIKRIISMLQYYFRLFSVSKHFEKPDVIIGSSAHPLSALAAIKISKKYKCRCIVEVRDLWPESFVAYGLIRKNNPLLKLLYLGEKWIYSKADKLIFTMEGGIDYIKEKGWDREINVSKVYHINNGIDLETFNYNKIHYIFDDNDLNDESTFKVVYTGSIRKTNNVRILVDTAIALKNRCYSKLKILVFGDGDEREPLERYVKDNNISNIVFKGKVDKKYIPYILSKCDLNILDLYQDELFRFGASPNKLFDYFASGKPVLAVKYEYDLIERYHCGTTIENIDTEKIADEISYYYNISNSQKKQISEHALEAAREYDFSVLTNKLVELF